MLVGRDGCHRIRSHLALTGKRSGARSAGIEYLYLLFTLTAANQDILEGTYTSGVTTAPPPNVEFLDLWTFTGGTGRFAHTGGSGLETGTVAFSQGFGPGAAFTVAMEGVISY